MQSGGADAQTVSVSAFCIAYELDIVELELELKERFGGEHVHAYPEDLKAGQTADIIHARYVTETGELVGDIFCFEARSWMPCLTAQPCMAYHIGFAGLILRSM
jgi:hypothetical protein